MSEGLAGLESALIVEVPAAEPIVSQWRRLYDPAAVWGVPAHITVLYPFVPAEEIDQAVLERIGDVVGAVHAFDFTLDAIAQFGRDVLILEPKPGEMFTALTAAVVAAWPDRQPYEGAHAEVIPHLTVAHTNRGASFDAISSRIAGHLPIAARADAVTLMVGNMEPGSWRTLTRLPLG